MTLLNSSVDKIATQKFNRGANKRSRQIRAQKIIPGSGGKTEGDGEKMTDYLIRNLIFCLN